MDDIKIQNIGNTNDSWEKETTLVVEKLSREIWDKILPQIYTNVITIFWLFASLLIYISVQVQILSSVCDFNRLVWTSFLIFWWMIWFSIMIYFVATHKHPNWQSRILPVIVTWMFFFVGIKYTGNAEQTEFECKQDSYKHMYQETTDIFSWKFDKIDGDIYNLSKRIK